jgi:hypothetical protein
VGPLRRAARTATTAPDRATTAVLVGVAAAVGAVVLAATHDVVIGIAAGAAIFAVASRIVRTRPGAHH